MAVDIKVVQQGGWVRGRWDGERERDVLRVEGVGGTEREASRTDGGRKERRTQMWRLEQVGRRNGGKGLEGWRETDSVLGLRVVVQGFVRPLRGCG